MAWRAPVRACVCARAGSQTERIRGRIFTVSHVAGFSRQKKKKRKLGLPGCLDAVGRNREGKSEGGGAQFKAAGSADRRFIPLKSLISQCSRRSPPWPPLSSACLVSAAGAPDSMKDKFIFIAVTPMTRCGGPDVYEYEFLNGSHLFLPGTITVCYCGPPQPPPLSDHHRHSSQRCRLQPGRVLLCSFLPTKVSRLRSTRRDYFTLGTMRDAACLRLFSHCKKSA